MATSREEALQILEEGYERVAHLLSHVSDEQFVQRATIGGGDWSAKELLGHLAAWESIALDTVAEWRSGEKPRIEEDAFSTADGVDRLNDEVIGELRPLPPEAVRARAQDIHERLVREIEGMSDDEWTSKAVYQTERRKTLGTLLASVLGAPQRPFGHASAHIPDLESYVASLS